MFEVFSEWWYSYIVLVAGPCLFHSAEPEPQEGEETEESGSEEGQEGQEGQEEPVDL